MKLNRSFVLAFGLLVLVSSLYRVWDGRPLGFAPQVAMAIFAGAVIGNRKLALLLPLLSMFLSDALYQLLYVNGWSAVPGFYEGQAVNYLLLSLLTVFGFSLRSVTTLRVAGYSISGSLLFFLLSNLAVWIGGGGYNHPKTFSGLMLTYADGVAFYRDYGLFPGFWGNLFAGDLFFCLVLFGGYALLRGQATAKTKPAL